MFTTVVLNGLEIRLICERNDGSKTNVSEPVNHGFPSHGIKENVSDVECKNGQKRLEISSFLYFKLYFMPISGKYLLPVEVNVYLHLSSIFAYLQVSTHVQT